MGKSKRESKKKRPQRKQKHSDNCFSQVKDNVSSPDNDVAHIHRLPSEMLCSIFSHLSVEDKKTAALVCKKWNVVLRIPSLWENMSMRISMASASNFREITAAMDERGIKRVNLGLQKKPKSKSWKVFVLRLTHQFIELTNYTCHFLQSLDMRSFILDVESLPDNFKHMNPMLHLKELLLSKFPVDEDFLKLFPNLEKIVDEGSLTNDVLVKVGMYLPKLQELQLLCRYTMADNGNKCAETILHYMPQLKKITFDDSNIGDADVELLAQLSFLEELSLSHNPYVTALSVHCLAQGQCRKQLKSLHFFRCYNVKADTAIHNIGQLQLTDFTIGSHYGREIRDSGIHTLLASCGTQLRKLRITGGTYITTAGIKMIAEQCTSLKQLHLFKEQPLFWFTKDNVDLLQSMSSKPRIILDNE